MEENRRVTVYLGAYKPIANISLTHSYSSKLSQIVKKTTGDNKSETIRILLFTFFKTDDIVELKERIFYAAANVEFTRPRKNKKSSGTPGMSSKIGRVCNLAIKKAIDNYSLSA